MSQSPDTPPPLPAGFPARPAAVPAVGFVGYATGALSFIPMIGIAFAAIAITWGIMRRAWLLVGLGVGGILCTVALYGTLFYQGFYHRGGAFDQLRAQMAVSMLDSTVRDIEFYKLQHGHYPAALSELNTGKPKTNMPSGFDPTALQRPGSKDQYFFYELDPSGNFYFLRSVGPDGKPFTADDVVPTFSEEERRHTGLRLER